MPELKKASEPFRFYTRMHLHELTGLRASNLSQLFGLLKEVPDSCIYHHTHRFLQQHHYFSPEPPNDFAYWIDQALGERELAERLASIDIIQFSDIRSLREKIVVTIGAYLDNNPLSKLKFSNQQEEFYFVKSVSFVLPTLYSVTDLKEFSDAVGRVSIDSIYFHIFEARLRLEKHSNDFSNWIETCLGDKLLAERISRLDPYTYTLEDLRKKIIVMAKERMSGSN